MESYQMDPVHGQKNHSHENLDPNDSKPRQKGPKRLIYNFFHYTTINGLQRLASAKTILGRIFWILVLLGAGAMFSKDIYDLIQQYFERPINVVSKVEYFRAMRFPAVTVCNANPLRKSLYEFSAELKNKLEERDNDTCFRKADRNKNNKCDAEKDEVEEFDNEIEHILSNIDVGQLLKSGHQRNDMIVSCRFNGIRCRGKRYWVQFWDPHYGNCYTFNTRLAGHDPNTTLFATSKPGSVYGLKLVLNLQLNEYIPQLRQDAGVRISITEPAEMPFPIYNSVSLAPGFQNEIALKRIQIKRVDRFENGSCRTDTQLAEKNPYRTKYRAEYSVQACLQFCYANVQISKCGCAEYSFFGAVPKGKICNENNEVVDGCIDRLKSLEEQGDCEKKCRDLCSETIYESSLTFSQWPYHQSVETVLESLGFNFSSFNNNVAAVRSNFLSANVYFQRFRETRVEETLSYGTANLLADIGGQIGLWAGLSVISMCELLELFALLIKDLFQKQRQ